MPLYYSDPSREPRHCGCHRPRTPGGYIIAGFDPKCPNCKGTGRLGEEGAEPDIETGEETRGQWFAYVPSFMETRHKYGPYPTEAEALAAAREAAKER